jgi:hypothetical protein
MRRSCRFDDALSTKRGMLCCNMPALDELTVASILLKRSLADHGGSRIPAQDATPCLALPTGRIRCADSSRHGQNCRTRLPINAIG